MIESKYFLGGPIWTNPSWKGKLYPIKTKNSEFLRFYSRHLNTVEGNTTFYALPNPEKVRLWREQTPSSFKFSFKFPREITHHFKLVDVQKEVSIFLNLLEPLEERLGRFIIQLPPKFDKTGLKTLYRFLNELPQNFTYGVEVRHLDFFRGGEEEFFLHKILRKFDVERVTFDTRTLHSLNSEDLSILEAQRKKPKVPERFEDLTANPMLRFVGSNKLEEAEERLNFLAEKAFAWIKKGKEPYIFLHSPDEFQVPEFCYYFDKKIRGIAAASSLKIQEIKTGEEFEQKAQFSF